MNFDYTKIVSMSADEFSKSAKKHDISTYTKSNAKDIKNIERLLDLKSGILSKESLYIAKKVCECGRTITFYDFIYTAIVDADHPKSFIVHTLLGSKFITNRARHIRCSSCNVIVEPLDYITGKYCCCRDDEEK